jgi:hypothetical protein
VSVTSDITNAIATLCAASDAGLTWHADGTAYTTGQTGIYKKRNPAGVRSLAISIVPQGDDPSQPLGKVMIQLRARGRANAPADPDEILDACFVPLHGAIGILAGSCSLIQLNRGLRVPMGQNDDGTWDLIDQYYSDVDYPPTTNRPDGGFW